MPEAAETYHAEPPLYRLCKSEEAVCPGCGNPLIGRPYQRRDAGLFKCTRRVRQDEHGGGSKRCGSLSAIVGASSGMCIVVRLSEGLFARLKRSDRPLVDELKAAGILTERAT